MIGVRRLLAYSYTANGRVLGHQFVVAMVIGMLAGFSFAYILLVTSGFQDVSWQNYRMDQAEYKYLSTQALSRVWGHDEKRSVADALAQKVRVLCWVMTQPKNHKKKAQHVKATWGKRCNVLLFMSTEEDTSLPTVKLPVIEDYNHLWSKTKEAFRYVYEHHRGDADWFLKVDDDTYVVLENLRYMLSNYSSKDPLYFGCKLKRFIAQGYMSGGAGYVLSRTALDMFINMALPMPHLCKSEGTGAEDVEMGACLSHIGVKAMDSRDPYGRGRLFPFTPQNHMFPSQDLKFWYSRNVYYPIDEGISCCSNYAVSFHYVPPQQMYVLDYLIYNLQLYGIVGNNVRPKQ